MSALREPDNQVVTQLFSTLRLAPRPISFTATAVRTGPVSPARSTKNSLWVNHPRWRLARFLFDMGIFPWLGNRSVAMDNTFWRLANEGLARVEN
jgi:hypothetical protein